MENIEKVLKELCIDKMVYPITMMKFLLNRDEILTYLKDISEEKINYVPLSLNNIQCKECKSKIEKGMLCRKHTSVSRVLDATEVVFDMDTQLSIVKNEIFKVVEDKLVIIYCPHTKLIVGDMSNDKVKKIKYNVICDNFKLSKKNTINFSSKNLLNLELKCWVNKQFSMITIPNKEYNWGLIPNF